MRIIGGFYGWKMAVDEAFNAKIMNPCVKYSPVGGFYVESQLIPTTAGDINLGQVYYSLNNGGRRSPATTRENYREIKREITARLESDGE